ncbi:MAG: hypothetical protein GF383_06255 [Candidatus Lokiarchaeota archaeon]|nr:hypothetical protein [Candidatus Lokiarchaeota archaeon]MBD3339607.1 hypothetical protein [Candidatus Lokiarchaeota archaeon]
MNEIRERLVAILDDIKTEITINRASLITEDGLVIATNSDIEDMNDEINVNFAAISASILSMAERGIEIINDNKILEQIKIDAGFDQNSDADFTILITRVYSNVLLLLIFPKSENIGLIQYETTKNVKKIRTMIKQDTSRELFNSLGSLT